LSELRIHQNENSVLNFVLHKFIEFSVSILSSGSENIYFFLYLNFFEFQHCQKKIVKNSIKMTSNQKVSHVKVVPNNFLNIILIFAQTVSLNKISRKAQNTLLTDFVSLSVVISQIN
jgi:hypothetical protein